MTPKKPQSRPPPSSSSFEEEENDDEIQPSQTAKKPTTSTPVAPKPAPVTKPSSSSGEDDEEEDDSGSDSEDPPINSNKKVAPPPPPPPPPPQQQGKEKEAPLSDSEESGSDESDSDDEPPKRAPTPPRRPTRGPDPAIEPITSMPVDAKSPSSSKKSGGDKKRKAPETMGDSPVPASGGPPAKKLFERVWNVEDEMVLLKAILRFKEKHGGRLPNLAAGVDELLEMVKNSVHVEFTKSQINTKIRTLKRRYEGILARPRTLSKSHEKSAFELSEKIWGQGPKLKAELGDDGGRSEDDDAMEEDVTKSNARKEKSVSAKKPNRSGAVSTAPVSAPLEAPAGSAEHVSPGGGGMYPVLAGAVEEVERFNTNIALRGLLRRAVGSLKPETANALEAKWKKQCMTELKVQCKRMKMLSDLLMLLEDAILDGSN